MYGNLINAVSRIRDPKETPLVFGPFVGGLVTSRPAEELGRGECTAFTNIVIDGKGLPRTRPGFSLVCTGLTGSVYSIGDARVDGTWYTFVSTIDDSGASPVYRLYRVTAGTATQIGSDSVFEGPITFASLQDFLIVFDTSYVKYWDGTLLGLLTDRGIGSTAYLINNYMGEMATEYIQSYVMVYAGVKSVGVKFTTPAWSAGFTMPPLTFRFRAAKTGNGAYSPYATSSYKPKMVIRKGDGTLMASKDLMVLTDLPTVVLEPTSVATFKAYEYTFEESEIVNPLEPSTEYYLCYEHAYGDVTNHTKIHITGNVASLGYASGTLPPTSFTAISGGYTGGVTNPCPTFSLTGEIPFKLETGVASASRIFAIEGVNGENPGRIWYCGAGNPFDWSSPNFGGYMDTGLDIAAIVAYYGNVWVFGSGKAPSLSRITGDMPSEYSMSPSIQAVSSHQRAVVVTQDDVLFYHMAGVDSISTVQEYGDIRSINRSDNISDVLAAEYDTNAFAGFDPHFGVYVLKVSDGTKQRLYAFHPRVAGRRTAMFPASKWELNLPLVSGATQEVTGLGRGEHGMYLGTDNGRVYRLDVSTIKDAGNYPAYSLLSGYMQVPDAGQLTATHFQSGLSSKSGGSGKLVIYRNLSTNLFIEKDIELAVTRARDVPDRPQEFLRSFSRGRLNFDFRELMVGYSDITPLDDNPIYFGPIRILAG